MSVIVKRTEGLHAPRGEIELGRGKVAEQGVKKGKREDGRKEFGSELDRACLGERENAIGKVEHADQSEHPVLGRCKQPERILQSERFQKVN